MKVQLIRTFFFLGVILSITSYAQESGSVGIGVENPNPNAILHLVSPGNNQGLLIPALSTSQRTAPSFQGNLTSVDNGLLVFDLNMKTFFYWQDSKWVALSAGNQDLTFNEMTNELSIAGGNTIDLSGLKSIDWEDIQNVPTDFEDADADPQNEIQDLELAGTILKITNNSSATEIDLGGIVNAENPDLTLSDHTLSLTNDLSVVDLSGYLDNTDNQTLSFDGENINLSGGNGLDVSAWDTDASDDFDGDFNSLSGIPADLLDGDDVNDGDIDPTNEIQDILLEDNLLTLSGSAPIDLSPYLDNTDNQNLSFDGTNIFIEGGTGIDISSWDTNAIDDFDGNWSSLANRPAGLDDGDDVNDADADPQNEIQSVTAGSGITVEPVGNDFVISNLNPDQTVVLTDGGSGNVTIGGTYPNLSIDVPSLEDDDADATNELQTISRIESEVTLSDGGGSFSIDDADADPANEIQDINTNDTPGNITISGGSTLSLNVDDADASATNELIEMASLVTGNTLRITDAAGDHDVDLTSLVDDADADASNEIQSISYDPGTNVLTLTKPTGVDDMVNLTELEDATPWTDNGTNIIYGGQYAQANNFISSPKSSHLKSDDIVAGLLRQSAIANSKFVPIYLTSSTNLNQIEAGKDGQEIILMVIGSGTLVVQNAGNLHLSGSYSLTAGSTIHLVYIKDQLSGTNFDGWMEISHSISAR